MPTQMLCGEYMSEDDSKEKMMVSLACTEWGVD